MRLSSFIQPKHKAFKGISWFALFIEGHPKAFAHFFELQYPGLFLYARKALGDPEAAKKIFLCAFADAWNHREGFTSEDQLKQFIRETVRKNCTTFRLSPAKARNNDHTGAGSPKVPADWDWKGPHMERIYQEILAEMFSKLELLPEDCKLILDQAITGRKTIAQLAAEWNISENAAAIRKSRAFKTLLSLLADPGASFQERPGDS
jgi:RNA polymerase sigma factor (sigma-70 family)